MKTVKRVEEIARVGNDCIYTTENGLFVRDIEIDAGLGEEVFIGELSDLHFNYCNAQDFEENDTVLMSTYKNRIWKANGESIPNARSCLEFLDDADGIVINGDTLDYLSYGTMEIMQKEIWDKHPDVIATLGGHEFARRMQGEIEDTMPYEEKLEILKKFWKHDIFYVSRLVKDKVLIVGMLNDRARFSDGQRHRLEADIALSHKKGYAVLIFFHEPIATRNPEHKVITEEDVMRVGDRSGFPKDFYTGITRGSKMAGSDNCDGTTKAVYEIITNNADVVKGIFSAHHHSDMHLDIIAKNSNGSDAFITQYIHTASAYNDGHLMRILVK